MACPSYSSFQYFNNFLRNQDSQLTAQTPVGTKVKFTGLQYSSLNILLKSSRSMQTSNGRSSYKGWRIHGAFPRCRACCRVSYSTLIVYEDSYPTFDSLVFIHGIQGHPKKTWTYGEKEKKPAKPKHRVAKIFSRKNQPEKAERAGSNEIPFLFWPKDLLAKDYPNVRILTYGYDSQVSKFFKGPANQSGILAHGESLIHALEVQRRGCHRRPIIFLAQSLGGIILKQVRVRSSYSLGQALIW